MAVVHLEEPKFRGFVAGTNAPLIGGKVYVYDAGTSDLATIYTSQDAGTEHTNPVILDANGEAEIWYNSSVKVIVKDSDDIQQYSFDNIVANIEPTVSGVYNLVQNGGFETDSDSDGEPDNWTLVPDTNGTIAIDSTAGNHSNGANSLKFTSGGSGGGSATTTPYSEVTASGYVQVAFRLKSSVATVKNIVTILWYQNSAGLASSTASTAVYSDTATNPTSWTYKSFSATVPSDAYYCKVKIEGVESSGTTITAASNTHFDDIRLHYGPDVFPNVTAPITASDADLNACTNFEETISSTTSEVSIATGKTLNIVDGLGSLEFNGTALTASQADLDATTNFEETISATTSVVSIATGKKLNIVDVGGFQIGGVQVTPSAAELNICDSPNTGSKALKLNASAVAPYTTIPTDIGFLGVTAIAATSWSSAIVINLSRVNVPYTTSITPKSSAGLTVIPEYIIVDENSFIKRTGATAAPSVAAASAGTINVYLYNSDASARDLSFNYAVLGTDA